MSHLTGWRTSSRRTVMTLIGIINICYGLLLIYDPYPFEGWVIYYAIPLPIRIWLWIGTGLIGIAAAVSGSHRWEWVGWLALVVMPIQRLLGHATVVIVSLIPGGRFGSPDAWIYVVLWAAALGMFRRISTWVDGPVIEEDEA